MLERQRLHLGDLCHGTHELYGRTWPGDAHDIVNTPGSHILCCSGYWSRMVQIYIYIRECQFKNSMVIRLFSHAFSKEMVEKPAWHTALFVCFPSISGNVHGRFFSVQFVHICPLPAV